MLPIDTTKDLYEILMMGVQNLYNKLNDPVDKFIVAFVFELNYTQSITAKCLNMTDKQISIRIKNIKKKLRSKTDKIK